MSRCVQLHSKDDGLSWFDGINERFGEYVAYCFGWHSGEQHSDGGLHSDDGLPIVVRQHLGGFLN